MYLTLIILSLLFSAPNEQADIFFIDNNSNENIYHYLKISDAQGSFKDLVSNNNFNWKEAPFSGLSLSPFSDKKWFKVTVSSHTNQEKLVSLDYELIHYGKVYLQSSITNAIISHDLSTSHLKGNNNKNFILKLKAGEIKNIFLELDGQGGSLCPSLNIYDIEEFEQKTDYKRTILLICRTLISLFIIICVLIWILTKDHIYGYFLAYLIGIALFAETEIGSTLGYFSYKNYDISYVTRIIANHLFIVGIYFCLNYFLYQKTNLLKHSIPIIYNYLMIPLDILYFLFPDIRIIAIITYSVAIIGSWVIAFFIFKDIIIPALRNKVIFSKEVLFVILTLTISSSIFISGPHLGLNKRSIFSTIIMYANSLLAAFFMIYILYLKWLYIVKENQRLSTIEQQHHQTYIQTIVESQEEERNRIGREIHDSLGGDLSFLKMRLHNQNPSIFIKKTLDNTISNVRALSHSLVTPYFETDYWTDEIQELTSNFSSNERIFTFNTNTENILLDRKSLEHLYRIIQELYINAEKHSQSSRVDLELFINQNTLELLYQDNGIGIDSTASNDEFQLKNIIYRVKLLNGDLKIHSKFGLSLVITIPI